MSGKLDVDRAKEVLAALVWIDREFLGLESRARRIQPTGLDPYSVIVDRQNQLHDLVNPMLECIRVAISNSIGIAACLRGYADSPHEWEVGLRLELRFVADAYASVPLSVFEKSDWIAIRSVCFSLRQYGTRLQAAVEAMEAAGAIRNGDGAKPPSGTVAKDAIDGPDQAILEFLNRTPTLRRKVSEVLPDRGPVDRKAISKRLRKLADRTPPLVDYRKGSRTGVAILPAGIEALKQVRPQTPH